jgi:formamidopyrimidine-DNA glycosylase
VADFIYDTMPELPEVESFRRLLMPLVSKTQPLRLTRLNTETSPPRKFLSDEEITDINQQDYRVRSLDRKGKLICLELQNEKRKKTLYCFIHMGMTGRISTPGNVPKLESLKGDVAYPPPYTYLKFSAGKEEACFSDPRKFGSVQIKSDRKDFDELAPDAHTELEDNRATIVDKLVSKSMDIKALLLDQKRALSGVGNWVADEVLYQMEMHPHQTYLTTKQANDLLDTLARILAVAVNHGLDNTYPKEWLFHYRWSKRKETKDFHGRTITFVTSGGRTSAIVPSIQKKKGQQPQTTNNIKKSNGAKRKTTNKDLSKNKKKGDSPISRTKKRKKAIDD